jgi:hypothetical protein
MGFACARRSDAIAHCTIAKVRAFGVNAQTRDEMCAQAA